VSVKPWMRRIVSAVKNAPGYPQPFDTVTP
jgi:hypothetical protein